MAGRLYRFSKGNMMDFKTKFDINERVYMLWGKDILEGNVKEILVSARPRGSGVGSAYKHTVYAIQAEDKLHRGIKQSILFKTKELAIQELIREIGYEVSEDDLKEI